ncbi:MAG TPA: HAD family hydrolase [Candidatus Lokiarchaeia archaeon]|nr:HAD family hydrolase [Candidatus Lokiarchaeia archaeon]
MPKILDGVKLVIFDLDGVIFDIIDAIRRSAEDGINKYSLKASVEETMADLAVLIERFQSIPIPQIILQSYELLKIPALEGFSLIKRLRIALYFYARFREYKDSAIIFPRIDEIIKNLADRAINVAVFTNQKASYAREVLERFALAEYVKKIFGFNEVSKTKPDPEGILKLMDAFGIKDPKQVIYVGDMITDVEAGLAAKVKTIAVGSGLVAKEKLQAAHPTFFVDDVPGLATLLGM